MSTHRSNPTRRAALSALTALAALAGGGLPLAAQS